MKRRANVLCAVGIMAIASSCGGDGTSGPPSPVAEPGELTVVLALPAGDDRAGMITITGPEAIGAITSANPAYTVYSRTSGATAKVAVFGRLTAGPILKFTVPDKNKSASYSANIVEVAGPANELREQLAGHRASVIR